MNNKEIVLQEDIRYIVIIDENTLKIENVIYIPYSGDYTKLNEGYLMKGHFIENQVIPAEYTADGKDIEIENPYEDYIVKDNEIIYKIIPEETEYIHTIDKKEK